MTNRTTTVGLIQPGAMGATIGYAAATSGARGIWSSEGRSSATAARAQDARLLDVKTLSNLTAESDIIISVCPPHAAIEVAETVAKDNFRGIYVDANAVSRATAEQVSKIVSAAGASFVDGGIIGSPVKKAGTTRLYLSGTRADEVKALFSQSMLTARTISAVPGEASALKVAYAAWSKGTDALILAIRALAAHEGVEQALMEEWHISQPALEGKCDRAAAIAAPKAWRYVGEMEEIAAAFAAAGLPAGFHQAAAEICQRLAPFKDKTQPPLSIHSVVKQLVQTTR